MTKRQLWSRILIITGGIAMVIGAIDPLEGSVLILPGSGLVALGTYLGNEEHKVMMYRLWGFILIIIGVAAMWYISSLGGVGGATGRSAWWGMLFIPYLVGWSIVIWGAGSPLWLCSLGIINGLFYLFLFASMAMKLKEKGTLTSVMTDGGVILSIFGVVTIIGCIYRLLHQSIIQIDEQE
jgi:hypothetical protein